MAVTENGSPADGTSWLKGQDVARVLQQQLDTLNVLSMDVATGRLPSSAIAGNYHPLVFAHMAWCLDMFSVGESFVAFAEGKDVGELGTPFWREYARGMGALVKRDPYCPSQLRLKGQEKYWMSYLHLIEAVCKSQGIGDSVTEVERQFVARNNDKSVRDDAYQIEGSHSHPVKWDFRRQGLLCYVAFRYH